MKKLTFLATMLVALASCTSTDEFAGVGESQNSKTPISFESPFVGKMTRGSNGQYHLGYGDIGLGLMTKYNISTKLYGVKFTGEGSDCSTVFDTYLHYSKDAQSWSAEETAYWEKDYDYSFSAIMIGSAGDITGSTYSSSPTLTDRKISVNLKEVPIVQFTRNAELDATKLDEYGIDVLVAATNDVYHGSYAQPVALSFKHILSRLDVYAYTTSGSETKIRQLALWFPKTEKITPSYIQKSYNDVTGVWSWSSEPADEVMSAVSTDDLSSNYTRYDLLDGAEWNVVKAESSSATTNVAPFGLFIAPTPTEYSFQPYLEITYVVDGVTNSKLIQLTRNKFEQGRKYNVYLCLDRGEEIKFDVAHFDWDEYGNSEEKDLTK